MPNNNKLPPEILRQILDELNILTRGPCHWTLTKVIAHYSKSSLSQIKADFSRQNGPRVKHTNMLNAMRVCKFWRNMVFSIFYKEDVSNWKWNVDDWTVCQRMMQLLEIEKLLIEGPTSWDVPVVGRRGTRKPGWSVWQQGDQW